MAREAKDILLKLLAHSLRGSFLGQLGVDLPPIVGALPAEIPTLTVRVEQGDLFFLLADVTVVHIELQSTSEEGDLERFSQYNYGARAHYRKRVFTVVLYGAGIAGAPDRLDLGSHVFTVRNVFLGLRDGEAVVAGLREKLARGAALDEQDRTAIKLLPLMRHARALEEVLLEVARIATVLPQEEQVETIGMMVGLAYNYLDAPAIDQLLEVLRMSNGLLRLIEDSLIKGREEGREAGRQEGREEGERRGYELAVRRTIERRFGAVPAALDARLAAADSSALDQLLARVLAASRVEDLLES